MSDNEIKTEKDFSFSIMDPLSEEDITKLGKALASVDRIRILRLLQLQPLSLMEISRELGIAISSTSHHIDALKDANLIYIEYQPNVKGHVKLCCKMALGVYVKFEDYGHQEKALKHIVEMPVGNFVDFNVIAPCGMANTQGIIQGSDNPKIFFTPERTSAQLVWLTEGFLVYHFPNYFLQSTDKLLSINFSLEICSEAMFYRNNWPSDITVWVNNYEIATYTSPGDFGGRKGLYTPDYWYINSTQFGVLKNFNINKYGSFLDGESDKGGTTIDELNLIDGNYIEFKIGIKPDALHKGGLNLFGKKFGDYPQHIIMTIEKEPPEDEV